MMTTEVTQGMYEQVMGYSSMQGVPIPQVVGTAYSVTWHMAADFNNLTLFHNIQHGEALSSCYDCIGSGPQVSCTVLIDPYVCNGYSLPTEAEWEYAARSGTTSSFWTGSGPDLGGTYSSDTCSGNEQILDGVLNPPLSNYAWYCGNNSISQSKEVGQLLPNGFGLFDLHGNVWEWMVDSWSTSNFPNSYTDPYYDVSSTKVVRGGFYNYNPAYLSVGSRDNYQSTHRKVFKWISH